MPEQITIRTVLRPGDLSYVAYLHGRTYAEEYGYSMAFEQYVALGLWDFYQHYDPERERVWLAEDGAGIVGSLLLMHRGDSAQLRFFLVCPPYRGQGLGRRLAGLFMDFLGERGYASAFLWTTHEQTAAARLYRQMGFQLTEEKPSTAFGKALREQRYTWFRAAP